MRDTCGIHAGYMRDTCICKGDQDTCEIHPRYIMRYMYLKSILRGTYLRCGIHAGYMRDTCGIHVSSEVIRIHAGDMRDTCEIHAGYMRDTCAGHVSWGFGGYLGECTDTIVESSAPIRPPMSSLCRSGFSPAPSSSCIFSFVMATLIPAGLPPMSSAKRINFSCLVVRVELALFFCFGISPWDPLPWIT